MCAVRMNALHATAAAASLTLAAALAANAGGFTPPIVDSGVTAPIVEVPAGEWAGGYAGVTLGYAFGEGEYVGFTEIPGGYLGTAGKLELSGANAGLRIGYRWQRNRWVFGPELGFEGGNIDDVLTYDNAYDGSTDVSSKVKSVLALRVKTGYAVQPDLLVYGVAGLARADIEYRVAATDDAGGSFSDEANYKQSGYILGLGVEKKLNDRMSVTGEYEYANFGKSTRTFTLNSETASTQATPDYHNLKLGLNFKF
ncbi:outer membrane beta-barrel protein [Paracoccus sp. pheM1]|uniref:outer membrane protein n=1 Tax=Paracoccus sp. pheM1 TaxID=2831675 RepID=UPI001BDB7847|nr:outer membrane beta-barrel protein [Paracoccus sp. pheM1]MBT0780481.1 outer membrane beta-barrel protein [Paracoccus sp. pheM1]